MYAVKGLHMKRKLIILLSSILAGSLLVGGAFAAYAVTDNADPFGFVATPGTYEEEGINYVTLEFGSTSALANIENVEAGKDYRAGIVSLKSTMNYTGDFTVRLVDRTTRTAAEEANKKLINYVTVGVYEGNVTPVSPATLPSSDLLRGSVGYGVEDHATSNTFALPGTAAGKEYSVFLSVSSDVGIYFSQMANDKVYVEVDWAPKAGDESTSYPVYFERPNAWGTLNPKAYVYAWKEDPHKENAVFPGVEMSHLRDGIYTAQIPNNLVNLVFNAGDNNDEHKTGDISLTGYNPSTAPYLSYNSTSSKWEWGALPEEQVLESSYSVKIGSGEYVAMSNKTDTDKTDGRLAEWQKQTNTVAIGNKLTFKAGEVEIGSTYLSYEGNITSEGKIKISGSVDIFLKIYNGTGEDTGHLFYSVYVSYPTNAVTFINSSGWSDLHFYAWEGDGGEGHQNAVYPGIALDTYVGVNEYEQAKYAIDWTGYEKIIISSGSEGAIKTVNIDVASFAGKTAVYLTGEYDSEAGGYQVGFVNAA